MLMFSDTPAVETQNMSLDATFTVIMKTAKLGVSALKYSHEWVKGRGKKITLTHVWKKKKTTKQQNRNNVQYLQNYTELTFGVRIPHVVISTPIVNTSGSILLCR